jgi:uroporphyrinogen decarboxylase
LIARAVRRRLADARLSANTEEDRTMRHPVTRRRFISSLGMTVAATSLGGAVTQKPGKREALLSLRDGGPGPGYVPAAFFLHFDEGSRLGKPAIAKHLEYFRATGMDFVKIQYERSFPPIPAIRTPADWKTMPRYGLDFYKPQLEVVDGLVKAAGHEALVLCTLYSPFMLAGQVVGRAQVVQHIEQDGEAVRRGLDAITESLLGFVRECRRLGVDGFYASTQGGEAGTFSDPSLFGKYVTPYDLRVMKEIDETCRFNILHACDYEAPYSDLAPLVAYPGHVVSCSPRLTTGEVPLRDLAQRFRRPIMGGMDRKGIIASGSDEEIRRAVTGVLKAAPDRFVLGADCTVPSETRWGGLRTAIETAHAFQRG